MKKHLAIFICTFLFSLIFIKVSLADEDLCKNKNGSLCNGEIKFISKTNYYTITNYKNGKKHGLHEIYLKETELPIVKYEYENGIVISVYDFYSKTNQVKSIASKKDNVKNGLYKDYYKNGKLKTEANYINGVIEGKVVRYLQDGGVYTSNYIKDGFNWIVDNKIVSIDSLYSTWINEANLYEVMKNDGIGDEVEIGYDKEENLIKYPGKYLGLTPLRADVNCSYSDICQKDEGIVRGLKFIDVKDIKIWDTSWYKTGILRESYYQVLQPVSLDFCQSLAPNFKSNFLECNLIKKIEPTTGSIGDQEYYYIYALFEENGEKLVTPLIFFSAEEEAMDFLKE